ncbi:hypothetical protein KY360_04290 [Candidatus Woesearchaeota archaeon]|nr:hypothetical protein [Candidatus Woesearchaeota archaeon]
MGKKKRSAPKKMAAKPKAKVEVTIKSKVLGEAPEEHHFVLSDGKRLKSLFELVDSLGKMGEDVFKAHVNKDKNDFSNWIKDVFKVPDLAKEISAINNQVGTEICLLRKLVDELKKEEKK